MKTTSIKRNARTHFEQIPVETVKKIALVRGPKKKTSVTNSVDIEPPAKKTEPYSMPLSSLCWTGH
jgi:hypothetical protein